MKLDRLTDYDNLNSFGSRMRARRLKPLSDLIQSIYAAKGSVSILDLGGRETYWKCMSPSFMQANAVKITILNLPSDLSGEESALFSHVTGDACDLHQYEDNAFDIVHSNSVIEHVGNWDRVKAFSKEARRLAPNIFIQTPYYWFPVEPHFIKLFHHWLPKPVRATIWMRSSMGQRGTAKDIDEAMKRFDDEPYLLDMRMFRCLFPDCRIIRERFVYLTKSLIAFRSDDKSLLKYGA